MDAGLDDSRIRRPLIIRIILVMVGTDPPGGRADRPAAPDRPWLAADHPRSGDPRHRVRLGAAPSRYRQSQGVGPQGQGPDVEEVLEGGLRVNR